MTAPTPLLDVQRSSLLFTLEADLPATSEAASSWSDAGLTVRSVRGEKMRTTLGFMDELSAALQFPHYFGSNWPALGECLSDMDWLLPTAGVVVLMRSASEVLVEEPFEELQALVHVIRRASRDYAQPINQGEWWDRPELPFHVVLQVSSANLAEVRGRWTAAGAEMAPLAG